MKKHLHFLFLLLFSTRLLSQDGSLDNSFNDSNIGINDGLVLGITLQPDKKILVSGRFNSYNGNIRNNIARLNPDGTLDSGFNPVSGSNQQIHISTVQPDGKILIGGYFDTYNGVSRNRIARLDVDGSLDTSFNPGNGANDIINNIVLLPDGKILIGGYFTSYNGISRNRIARLNADGSLDSNFNYSSGANNNIHDLILQPDGKILIVGDFMTFNDISMRYIARLNSDGTLDTSFTGNASNTITSILLQKDGKILIAGYFTTYNGVARNRVARLTSNGALDTEFDPGDGANGTIYSMASQSDGKILIGGDFTTYNNNTAIRLARLNSNGSIDNSFNVGTGTNSNILDIVLQSDNKILVGGAFSIYNSITKKSLIRLNNEPILSTTDFMRKNIFSYPNPVKDILYIENAFNNKVYIYNMIGNLVKEFEISNNKTNINLSSLEKGNYILISTNGKEQKTFKIIKQ
ncbi:T9SS type A sorting domain-containing protein [Epilithonimonas hungarica]|uniref:Delta-60 repeat domain-containing protein/Por secretion system C-terminal sorting domain-containing protein n=1 Tax=Epilithonimonas hungarica TaxID=454006 RepID=A0A1G7PSF1_9FLAO|nr:T9SS type A sorting domain-containing protein [Epilithonimonas hungarica]SDF88330.1 delta-60 repeat domain-containing protein/Por secretion system C-terminal sorting domain-containing protein [Epilithonimonas hungarica]